MSTSEVPINLHGGWAQTGPESWVRVDHLVTIAIDHSLGDNRVRWARWTSGVRWCSVCTQMLRPPCRPSSECWASPGGPSRAEGRRPTHVVRRVAAICGAGLAVAASPWLVAMSVRTGGGSLLREAGTVRRCRAHCGRCAGRSELRRPSQSRTDDADGSPVPAPSGPIAGSGERVIDLAWAYPSSPAS